MTQGSIWKLMVRFAIPIFLGNLFQQFYNVADTFIVGNVLGTEAMADCDAILYQVADQPLLEQDTVRRELEYFRTHPDHIVGLAHNGVRGNPCIFPRKFFPELMALEGDVGGNVVIRAHPDALLLYETSAAELRDVDTVEALAAVQEDRQI